MLPKPLPQPVRYFPNVLLCGDSDVCL